jgi:hypothetical protein
MREASEKAFIPVEQIVKIRNHCGQMNGSPGQGLNNSYDLTAQDHLAAQRLTGLLDYVEALVKGR